MQPVLLEDENVPLGGSNTMADCISVDAGLVDGLADVNVTKYDTIDE